MMRKPVCSGISGSAMKLKTHRDKFGGQIWLEPSFYVQRTAGIGALVGVWWSWGFGFGFNVGRFERHRIYAR